MDSTRQEKNKERCCGCSACVVACPKQCISMQADNEGFLYPEIDKTLCIQCGKCKKVCPVINNTETNIEPDCYVAYSKDDSIRKHSSSGGMFTELANMTLADYGLVFGAALDENMKVYHKGVSSMEELKALQGSKYVQSEMGTVYRQVKEAIDAGRPVYFSGTPCQVAGLYTFLGNRPENLITQDIICHGVPSPLVWEKYVNTYRQVQKAEFRNKKYGWHYFSMHIQTTDRDYYKRLDEDFYLKLFLDNTTLRPICYNCPIKSCGSHADITLGDCWALHKVTDQVADTDEGLSLVVVNTERGKSCMSCFSSENKAACVKVDSAKAMGSQSTLKQSVKSNPRRTEFFEGIYSTDFSILKKNWYKTTVADKLRVKCVFLKTRLRTVLKNIRN